MNRVSTSYPPRYPQGYPPPSGPDPRRVDDLESIILTWQTLLLLARLRRPEGPCPAARSRPLGQLRAWEHHSNSCGMSVAGVPSHQQHLSCPRHERSLYRMSKRSRPPTSQRGKGSSIPAVPGIGHEEASRATVAQRGPIKGRGITPSARPVRCMPSHCIAADSAHIGVSESDVAPGVRQNVLLGRMEQREN